MSECLSNKRLQKQKSLPKYEGATGSQITHFLPRKILPKLTANLPHKIYDPISV